MKILFRLDCGHVLLGDARSSVLVCNQCIFARQPSRRYVVDVIPDEWRVKCFDCPYARWTGLSDAMAKVLARRHRISSNHDKCYVAKEINPNAVKARKQMISAGIIAA